MSNPSLDSLLAALRKAGDNAAELGNRLAFYEQQHLDDERALSDARAALNMAKEQLQAVMQQLPVADRPLDAIPNAIKHGHFVNWWGSPEHPDLGFDSRNPQYIHRAIDFMFSRGILGANLLVSSQTHHNAQAAVEWVKIAKARGIIVSVMIDHPEWHTVASIKWIQDALLQGENYLRTDDGSPVLTLFDPLTDAQLAAVDPKVKILYRNAGGLSRARAAGVFGWLEPGNQPAYDAYFAKMTAAPSQAGKFIMPSVSPGMLGASWNLKTPGFKPTPWDFGKEWWRSIQRVLAMAATVKFKHVLIATMEDCQEQTDIMRPGL